MTEWIARSVVLAIHDAQIAEHGGLDDVRDIALLESALLRPHNLAAYEKPDLADLAACYAFAMARNHAFLDGNKRTSAVVTRLFLQLNGATLNASAEERLKIWTALGAGDLSETELATWLRGWLSKPASATPSRTRRT